VETVAQEPRVDGVLMRRLFLGIGGLLFGFGVLAFAFGNVSVASRRAMPIDLNVNWIAAQRLVDRQPLYERAASHDEAVRVIGPEMRVQENCIFCGFVGPPATALLHVPFLALGHDDGVTWFRVIAVLGMVGAVLLTVRVLPSRSRAPAALLGVGALLASFPLANTIDVGQGNEFVMLGLAAGIWGVTRRRWGVAGIGLGVATILKVSPVLLILYLLLRGERRPAIWAAATAAALSVFAALLGRPLELWDWLRDVAPEVGRGSLHVWNQSIVGWLARLTSSGHADLAVQRLLPQFWSLLAYALAGLAILRLWRWRRNRPIVPLELGVIVLVALLVGPLSWEHYFVWAFIPFVLCFDVDLWAARRRAEVAVLLAALVFGTYLLTIPVQSLWTMSEAAPWRAALTSPATGAAVLYLAVVVRLLATVRVHEDGEARGVGDERGQAVRSRVRHSFA
jgi:alpha-1,2-mannosyltransferase